MKTPDDRKEFVKRLLAQDPPPPDQRGRHQETLFRKLKQRILWHKITAGATYIILAVFALWAYHQQRQTDSIARSMLWGAVSVSILLWFLVGFLRYIYRELAQLTDADASGRPRWRQQDRLVTTVAVVMLVFHGLLLYRSFSLTDALLVGRHVTAGFWVTGFFLLWYSLGLASLVARTWLEHKKMELRLHDAEERSAGGQP